MATVPRRTPAVAGLFYPGDARVLNTQVGELLSTALPLEAVPPPKAIIVPHAGYIYSGPVAAAAYAAISPLRADIRRVVLLGPAHRMAVRAFALPAAQVFATPLGDVPVSRQDWLALHDKPEVEVDDRPHALEHSLEVQLPFLQSVLDGFELVPVLVGDAHDEAVAALLDELWGGPETLVVVSSDLSHYHSYQQAQMCDRSTVRHILELHADLDHQQACGATPVNGLIRVAARRGLRPHLLDLRNSGDTAGDRARVVGYASIAFCADEHHAGTQRH